MDAKSNKSKTPAAHSGKVGSDPDAAKHVGGPADFGVPETARSRAERDYVSQETLLQDPGVANAHSGGPNGGVDDGARTSGVGGNASGPGSSSGGDLDPDFVGIAGGAGLAQSAPNPDAAPDVTSPRVNANRPSPATALPRRQTHSDKAPVADRDDAQGADSVNNPLGQENDAFAGEVSSDEASGENDAR